MRTLQKIFDMKFLPGKKWECYLDCIGRKDHSSVSDFIINKLKRKNKIFLRDILVVVCLALSTNMVFTIFLKCSMTIPYDPAPVKM